MISGAVARLSQQERKTCAIALPAPAAPHAPNISTNVLTGGRRGQHRTTAAAGMRPPSGRPIRRRRPVRSEAVTAVFTSLHETARERPPWRPGRSSSGPRTEAPPTPGRCTCPSSAASARSPRTASAAAGGGDEGKGGQSGFEVKRPWASRGAAEHPSEDGSCGSRPAAHVWKAASQSWQETCAGSRALPAAGGDARQ